MVEISATTRSGWSQCLRRFGAYDYVRVAVGLLLLAAASLKSVELLTNPDWFAFESDLLSARWVQIAAVEVELFLGLCLLMGVWRRIIWGATLLLFVVFTVVSATKLTAGSESCGCFGSAVDLHPAWSLLLGVAVIVLLGIFRPRSLEGARITTNSVNWIFFPADRGSAVEFYRTMIALTWVPLFGIAITAKHPTRTVSQPGLEIVDGRYAVIEPREWIGQRFPLLDYIDIPNQLASGNWIAALFHHDCTKCRDLLNQNPQLADGSRPIVFVEIPPYGDSSWIPEESVHAKLSDDTEWIVTPPVTVALQEGIVTATGLTRNSLPDFREAHRNQLLDAFACGPLSFIEILKELSIGLSRSEREAILSVAGTTGTNLQQLSQLAENHGVHSLGVELSTRKLKQLNRPAIVHLNGFTFAAVIGYYRGGVEVVYPLRDPMIVSDAEFEKLFGDPGRALLLSDSPIRPDELGIETPVAGEANRQRPGLEFGNSVLALGRLYSHQWTAEVELFNTGTEPVSIKRVMPSCDCIETSVDDVVLQPESTTSLQLKGEQRDLGKFGYRITVVTDHATSPVVELPVRGYLAKPVLVDSLGVLRENVGEDETWTEAPLPATGAQVRTGLRMETVMASQILKEMIVIVPRADDSQRSCSR